MHADNTPLRVARNVYILYKMHQCESLLDFVQDKKKNGETILLKLQFLLKDMPQALCPVEDT